MRLARLTHRRLCFVPRLMAAAALAAIVLIAGARAGEPQTTAPNAESDHQDLQLSQQLQIEGRAEQSLGDALSDDTRELEPHEPEPENSASSTASSLYLVLLVQCMLIVLASLLGGWVPLTLRPTHTSMQLTISFVGGLMLGIALFHMLPHSLFEIKSIDRAAWWMVVGILTMFFLLRMFHFHQHEPVGIAVADANDETKDSDEPLHTHAHAHSCGDHRAHQLSWIGVTFGLSLHTLIDGIALGASVHADARHDGMLWLLGIGTFLAILMHKPLDAVSITSLMLAGGWSRHWQHLVNIGFAMMCPLGAALFTMTSQHYSGIQNAVVGCALAFSAGVFVCIALSDLLPELAFHGHDRVKLSMALLAGVALAYGIGFLEPTHLHSQETHQHVTTDTDEHGIQLRTVGQEHSGRNTWTMIENDRRRSSDSEHTTE